MSEESFEASRKKAIERHAEDEVRHGFWTPEHALEASRADFDQLLPQGRETPHFHLCKVIDENSETAVGETWYTIEQKRGKAQFWVHWIWIEPQFRRRGYATQVFQHLEREARKQGASRIGLHVLTDNAEALALYAKLGCAPTGIHLSKLLNRTDGVRTGSELP